MLKEQLDVISEVMPFLLLKMNAEYYAIQCVANKEPIPELVEQGIKFINEILYDAYRKIPTHRRDSTAKAAKVIASRLYKNHLLKSHLTTQDITVIVHNWMASLQHSKLLVEVDTRCIYIFRYLDILFRKAARGRTTHIDKDEFASIYIKAREHTPKIHEIALKEGLYVKEIG